MKNSSLIAIIRALNSVEVPFIVVGGVAVIHHGYGRPTRDVDLVIRLDPWSVKNAFSALASIGYLPRVPITAEQFAEPTLRAAWRAEKGMLVLVFHSDAHVETPLDVFVSEPFPFEAEYANAHRIECAPETVMRVLRLPTLLSMKREAGRQKDLADIEELSLLSPLK